MSLLVLRSGEFLVHSLILSKKLLFGVAVFVTNIAKEYSCQLKKAEKLLDTHYALRAPTDLGFYKRLEGVHSDPSGDGCASTGTNPAGLAINPCWLNYLKRVFGCVKCLVLGLMLAMSEWTLGDVHR